MSIYLQSIEIDEFGGRFTETIEFSGGLNFLSGENGTGKTTLIKKIKEYATNNNSLLNFYSDIPNINTANQLEIFALSPKRNSEKKNIAQLYQFIRQQNKTMDTLLSETKAKQINDITFDTYASFGELFTVYFEVKCKNGERPQKDILKEVEDEFNEIILKVFPNLKLKASWNQNTGNPDVRFETNKLSVFNIENLSCGQQEVLSLIFNLYVTKDRYHIYVIDEPEVHLNWNLEKGLFGFFKWFCSNYNKQLIISTHSRLIFTEEYYKYVSFLVWDEGHIISKKHISSIQKEALVGDLLNITESILQTHNTIFVEDKSQKITIEQICSRLGIEATTVICGNCENVKSLFRFSLSINSPTNNKGLFLIDGDNTGAIKEFKDEERFIKLEKYSIESYIIDPRYASKVLNTSEKLIRDEILEIIILEKNKIFNKGKSAKLAIILIEKLKAEELTNNIFSILDCSKILTILCDKNKIKYEDYVAKYIDFLSEQESIQACFDEKLINAIETIKPANNT